MGLTKEQAEKLVNRNLRYIKKRFKEKIAVYDPLDFKTAYRGFIQSLHADDCSLMRRKPDDCDVKPFLEDLIKNYLIENAYYALEEQYVRKRIMNKLGITDPQEIKLHRVIDFINRGLEANRLERLKKFEEKCKFKTYLAMLVGNLLYDFWRRQYKEEKNETKYTPEFDDFFLPPVEDPFEALVESEEEETKSKALKILHELLIRLEPTEKLALQLKYEQNMKLSEIARTLGITRYKAEIFIKQIQQELAREIKRRQL